MSAVLKINCQITPKTTPPIKFGIKKKVRKRFELFNLEVTRSARPNATRFTRITETITNFTVNPSVDQKMKVKNYQKFVVVNILIM